MKTIFCGYLRDGHTTVTTMRKLEEYSASGATNSVDETNGNTIYEREYETSPKQGNFIC